MRATQWADLKRRSGEVTIVLSSCGKSPQEVSHGEVRFDPRSCEKFQLEVRCGEVR